MKPTLSLLDPLAAREVAIHITLPPGDEPREGRPVLMSVGSGGQAPLFREGRLSDLAELITDAWATFGARVELQAAQTANDTETAVIATADVGNANDANGTDDSTVETAASTSAVPAGSNADQRQRCGHCRNGAGAAANGRFEPVTAPDRYPAAAAGRAGGTADL